MGLKPKLNLVTLGVENLLREAEFFEKSFGWTKSKQSVGDLVVYDFGGYALSLHPRQALAEDAQIEAKGSGFSGITLSFNAPSEQEVDRLLALVVRFGGKLVKRAQKASWGGYNGYFACPEGHLFEVAYNPYWPLDSEGRLRLD